jgi:hypothetical protein
MESYMKSIELIKVIADLFIAIFTAALVWVTYVLAKHTKSLNAFEVQQKRIEDIKRCIFLVESIIHLIPQESEKASFTEISPHISELLTLSKYLHDSSIKKNLEEIVYLDNFANDNTAWKGEFRQLRNHLPNELLRLQRDLGNYPMVPEL